MRVFLSLCVFVATAVAHPTACPPCENPCSPPPCTDLCPPPCGDVYPPPCGDVYPPPCGDVYPPPCGDVYPPPCSSKSCSTTTVSITTETRYVHDRSLYPPYIPSNWNIATFDSVCATHAFQGPWYLSMCPPISGIDGLTPLHTGIFYTNYPCCNPRICFQDTTPHIPGDFKTDFYMVDMSFNLLTQQIEKTHALLKAAYPGSSLAMFNVATQPYYPSPIKELEDIIDEKLCRHKCDNIYTRDYTIACIGADEGWKEYMIFVVVNKYSSLFCGNDNHFILVLTRKCSPDWLTYEKVYNDIKGCGLSPYHLISVDQSIDFTTIPNICAEDIEGYIDTSIPIGAIPSSSSTVEFVLKPDYKCLYDIDVYDHCGKIKILKNLQPDIIREILKDNWYVNSATPCLLKEYEKSKFGFLNTVFPCRSLQVLFDSSCSWSYESPLMMLERGYNTITGEITHTRNIIKWAYGPDCPYPGFVIHTEGCYGDVIPKCTKITPNGCKIESPGSLYSDHYISYIIGHRPNEYVIFYMPPTYTNLLCESGDEGLVYVLTRSRVACGKLIEEINQQLLYCGLSPSHLISIDQYLDITDKFDFTPDYFEFSYPTSSCSSSCVTVEKSCTSNVVVSSCGC